MSKPSNHLIIAPISATGKVLQPILIEKKSWLWKLFEKFAWGVVFLMLFAICAFGVWIYTQAY